MRAGERVPFVLMWHPSHSSSPPPVDPMHELDDTMDWWKTWCGRCAYQGPWRDEVMRSLITLESLTFEPTGGIVAAPTTSLPERTGGVRNWDYRFCWLRDATYTLYALMIGGYTDEASAWRNWLLRAVAGDPSSLHIMYGMHGERRLTELELPWLPGYENSRPVRIGNAASTQFQLDVYGEVMDALHLAHRAGLTNDADAWALAGSAARSSRDRVAGAGRRDLGGARTAAPLHPFEDHGLGRLRSRGQSGRTIRRIRARRSLACS